jgi:hypothetical protein
MNMDQKSQRDAARVSSTMKSYRSHAAEVQDKADLARDRQELAQMENNRRLFGGAETHAGYAGGGVKNKELSEKKERIQRREADERMYARDK